MYSRIRIEVISGLYNELINYLTEKEFLISSVKSTQYGVTFICRSRDYYKIAKAARKYQCRTKVIQRKGIYFFTRKYIKRKSIAVSAVCVLLYIFLFSKLIWRIDVISPDIKINESVYNILYNNQVYTGSVFSQELNQRLIQQIFMDVEDVGYVTLNFYKGVLTCTVDPTEEKEIYIDDFLYSNITATQNGVIKELRVYSGFSDLKAGQTVTKGQMLVSSTYIDRNGYLHQVIPRAYIEAECIKKYTVQVDMNKKIWVRTGNKTERSTIKAFGRDIQIPGGNISDDSVYDTERYFRYVDILGFRLPFTIEKTIYYEKDHIALKKDEKTALSAAKSIMLTIMENDNSLLSADSVEYMYNVSGDMLTLDCTVHGLYDITK